MLKKLLSLLRPSSSTLPSAYGVVQKELYPQHFHTVLRGLSDSRLLFETVAFALERTEADLMEQIATRLRLPFSPEVPVAPEASDRALRDFALLGGYPMLHQGDIVGAYCIDPASLGPLLAPHSSLTFVISTWTAIRTAREQSEAPAALADEHQGAERPQASVSAHEAIPLGEEVLRFLLDEAADYQANSLSIETSPTTSCYRFRTHEGREATGEIHPAVTADLLDLLSSLAEPGAPLFDYGQARFAIQSSPTGFLVTPSGEATPQFISLASDNSACPSPPSETQPPQVLVADDSTIFQRVVERNLTPLGLTTKAFKDGKEILSYLERTKDIPRLIICDVHMPGVGGRQVIEKIKRTPRLAQIPCIMLSSDDSEETELELILAGAETYLPKSRNARILFAHVRRILHATPLTKGQM